MPKRSQTRRDVIGVKTLAELVRGGLSLGLSNEPPVVQGHLDGTWTVHYPEEGFIPEKPGQAWPMTQSFWPGATGDDPHDLEAALNHARAVCLREPKIQTVKNPRNNLRS